MIRKILIAGFSVLLPLSTIGCGGSSSGSNSISSQQAAVVMTDIYSAMAEASASEGAIAAIRKVELVSLNKAILKGAPATGIAESITPAKAELKARSASTVSGTISSYTFTCPQGGNITVSGSYSETAAAPSYQVSMDMVEAINSCQDSGITMVGDPNVTLTDSGSDNGTTTTDTVTMTGGVKAGSSTCTIDVNISISASDSTGHGSFTSSGSICGISVNESETL
jgi:hypothetical protein